jgi:CRP/FNR family transcriptional regulator, anaerobic regulatory protein
LAAQDVIMLAPAQRHLETLPAGHPCFGCDVRARAVCGVLECSDLAGFKQLGWTLVVAPGQALFHEGDRADRVFTLTNGCVKLYKLLPDGRRQVTGFLFPGDFLGVSVFDEHAFTAEALGECQLCWFPRSRFDHYVEKQPAMERELYRAAAHELAAAQQQLVLLGRKTAAERLASFFLELAAKADGCTSAADRSVNLPMSRSDIADYLGITKETVSRVFSAFKRDRLIRLETLNRIQILDEEGLRDIADGGLEL